MQKRVGVLITAVLIVSGLGVALHNIYSAAEVPKQRGVSWVAGDQVSMQNLRPLIENHVSWLVQTPFGWQHDYNSASVRLVTDGDIFWGERDVGIETTAALSRQIGVKTLLKPHIWLNDMSGGKWRGEISMDTEEDWQKWFNSYQQFILHYARLAEKNKLEALCVGTELRLTALRESNWRNIIEEVRKVYSGQLTYAANWYLEFEEIKFWDALDFIGIQAYFPLSDTTSPSLAELIDGWAPHKSLIDSIATTYNRPVVFTEIGYRSAIDAAIEPWQWPARPLQIADEADLAVQATCYEAFFETFWKEEWCGGAYFWKWFPKISSTTKTYRNFTPQNKPAEKVMAKWYGATAD